MIGLFVWDIVSNSQTIVNYFIEIVYTETFGNQESSFMRKPFGLIETVWQLQLFWGLIFGFVSSGIASEYYFEGQN